jgi:hypothetical protein
MFVSQSYQILNDKTKELIKHYEKKLRFFLLHLPFRQRRNHNRNPTLTDKLNAKVIRGKFHMFAVLNFKIMNSKKFLARVVCWWYWKQPQRVLEGVGQLTHAGFIFPKFQDYEYKHPYQRNRIAIS